MKRLRALMAHAGRPKAESPATLLPADTNAPRVHPMFKPRSYTEGIRAGVVAYRRGDPITAFERVGLDDYARGFRKGYFTQEPLSAAGRDATGARNAS